MNGHEEKAAELFRSGLNCSQAVFVAFCDKTGFSEEQAKMISAPFGGGLARLREVCGAVSAMSLVAGRLWGYTDTENPTAKKEHYALVSSLANGFKDVAGTYICREILGLSKDTVYSPEATPRTQEFYSQRPCERCVRLAARLLDEELAKRIR